MTRLVGFERSVSDLAAAERFYVACLGFTVLGRAGSETRLDRGGVTLALQQADPPWGPSAAEQACDQSFQHLALPVRDIGRAFAALPPEARPISRGGPQRLPPEAGGVVAYKFRDLDGHPLELIQFPDGRMDGIDHSAIVVADAVRSIAFYEGLGMRLAARQTNSGPAQDRLDGLEGAVVDIIALDPAPATPHVELLAYSHPAVRAATPGHRSATRMVFAVRDRRASALTTDPDGHALRLVPAMD